MVDIWGRVRALRLDLADRVGALDESAWDAASWCEGWRVRDVIGHLVHLAEASQLSMVRDLVRDGVHPDRAFLRHAQRLGEDPVPALLTRLRAAAGGRFHMIGTPAAITLGEVSTHSADVLRPLGVEQTTRPEDAGAVLGAYRRLSRVAFHRSPNRPVRLAATDLDWAHGDGPLVEGRAIDLLLALANRRQVLADLAGPGVALL